MEAVEHLSSKPNPSVIARDRCISNLIHDRGSKECDFSTFDVCHDPGVSVSREPNTHSGSFNNSKRFSTDVAFNTFYSIAKSR